MQIVLYQMKIKKKNRRLIKNRLCLCLQQYLIILVGQKFWRLPQRIIKDMYIYVCV